jgi:hypothetical protein
LIARRLTDNEHDRERPLLLQDSFTDKLLEREAADEEPVAVGCFSDFPFGSR